MFHNAQGGIVKLDKGDMDYISFGSGEKCLVMIPAVLLIKECVYSAVHGTIHGFNGEEMLYGFSAFIDTFTFYLCFFFPLFFLWGCLLIAAVSLTIAAVVVFKKSAE